MLRLLQQYLRINTAHPHPDYQSVIDLFIQQAHADGLAAHVVQLPSNKPVLIITLEGTDQSLPALMLNHHMDVVPAGDVNQWKSPPFAGNIQHDLIIGRGTQDCKGLGIAQYGALQKLKLAGITPKRNIHVVMVPDEELGGFQGTKQFVEHDAFKQLRVGYVLDEGLPSGSSQELLIKIDEKTPIQIRVISKGELAHAAHIGHHNASHELITFLAKLVAHHNHQKLYTPVREAISMHVTSLQAGANAINVIPDHAQATLDIRVPSGTAFDTILNMLNQLIGEHQNISYEILASSKDRYIPMNIASPFYQSLSYAAQLQGFKAVPFAFEATTDARFYSARGIEALGFTPFSCKANLHGKDESIALQDLDQAIAILYEFLLRFCG